MVPQEDITMRRIFAVSLVAGFCVVLGTGAAGADETLTLRADDSVFVDLTQRATSTRLELGERAASTGPDFVETLVMEGQPLRSSVVQGVVARGLPDIQYCYERAMARVKAPSGEVSLSFVILPRGNVAQVKVEVVGPRGKGLEKCMSQRVRKWQFPANDVQTEVAIPLMFDLGGQ